MSSSPTRDALSSAISRREFEAEAFDAKGWINAQLRGLSSGDAAAGVATSGSSSAVVQTLVMKLQLMSADAQSSLAQASSELFTALPKSVRQSASAPSIRRTPSAATTRSSHCMSVPNVRCSLCCVRG